ncbi:MAG: hypothetical protein OEY56_09295 [Cyclobacteriaceae bacterium]|nr:hypothetical protein [Cyclobacteriaceae bacterium]
MLRSIIFAGLVGCVVSSSFSQTKRFYSLSDADRYDTVDFTLTATSGISFVRHVDGGNPLDIFGNPDLNKINPSFDSRIFKRTCRVLLSLEEYRTPGFGNGLAYAMTASKKESESNYWKFLLNDNKVYNLNLNYGIGSSDVDLSGTSIHSLKIHSGSADVVVNYDKEGPNRIVMDTFLIKVDLGTLIAKDLDHARPKNVLAEIGFGQALLDFSHPLDAPCQVNASVGAGKLMVILPQDMPVIIYIKDSPLCSINMASGYKKVSNSVYTNMDYEPNAPNLLTFFVDVALGTVNFNYSH